MAFGKKRLPTPKEEKLPFFKFLAWKSSDVASAVAYLIVSTYLMRFCTDFLGLDSLTVGNILLISNIVDFITDFIGAVIVDNTNTQIGRGRPYELSIVGVTICTILLFATPTSWSDTVKYLWVFFVYTFEFGVFNTMRGAGQNAYTIRAWKNRKVIGKLSSYGGFVTTIGSMCVSLSFPVLMGTIATTAEGWLRLVAIYMVPLTLIGTLRFIFVKEDTSVDAHNHEKVDFKAIFRMLKKNKYGWYYAGIMLLFNTIQSLGTLSYYWKYIVGDESLSGMFSIFSIILMPVMLFFPPDDEEVEPRTDDRRCRRFLCNRLSGVLHRKRQYPHAAGWRCAERPCHAAHLLSGLHDHHGSGFLQPSCGSAQHGSLHRLHL